MKFPEISCHMLVIGAHSSLVLEGIVPLYLLMHFEATLETMTWISRTVPKKMTLSLYFDPKEVS